MILPKDNQRGCNYSVDLRKEAPGVLSGKFSGLCQKYDGTEASDLNQWIEFVKKRGIDLIMVGATGLEPVTPAV